MCLSTEAADFVLCWPDLRTTMLVQMPSFSFCETLANLMLIRMEGRKKRLLEVLIEMAFSFLGLR